MPVIPVVASGSVQRERLSAGTRILGDRLRLPVELRVLGSGTELCRVTASSWCPVAVFSPGSGNGEHDWRGDLRVVRRLKSSRVAVILYLAPNQLAGPEVLPFVEAGTDALLQVGYNDSPPELSEALDRAMREPVARTSLRPALDVLPQPFHPLLETAVLRAGDRLGRWELATTVCARHPRTVNDRLRKAGLPSLREFVMWGRILAARAHQRVGASAERAAALAGFLSGSAYRNATVLRLGEPPCAVSDERERAAVASAFSPENPVP